MVLNMYINILHKSQDTLFKNYGVKNPMDGDTFKNKMKQTTLYMVSNIVCKIKKFMKKLKKLI